MVSGAPAWRSPTPKRSALSGESRNASFHRNIVAGSCPEERRKLPTMASASAPSDTGLREATTSPSIDLILSAASTTSTEITRFVRSVRAAHADLVAVTRELSDLRLLLELLRDEHNLPSQLQDIEHGLPALLRDCKRVLTQIQDALSQCNGDAGEWVRVGKTSIEESGGELETLRRSLGLALEVVNLSVTLSFPRV